MKERIEDKEEILRNFWEGKKGREESCKVSKNIETTADERNRKFLIRKTGRYKESRREKVNQ